MVGPCEWSLEDLRNRQKREQIVNDIVTSNVCQRDKQIQDDETCGRMHWLEHPYKRDGGKVLRKNSASALFSALKKIFDAFSSLDDQEPWGEHTAWQNLYAFSNKRNNPTPKMMDAQRATSAALLRHSLDRWNPGAALFFSETNGRDVDWWSKPFLAPLGISDFRPLNKRYLISIGKLSTGGTAYFLTRPDKPGIRRDDYIGRAVEELREAGLQKV